MVKHHGVSYIHGETRDYGEKQCAETRDDKNRRRLAFLYVYILYCTPTNGQIKGLIGENMENLVNILINTNNEISFILFRKI